MIRRMLREFSAACHHQKVFLGCGNAAPRLLHLPGRPDLMAFRATLPPILGAIAVAIGVPIAATMAPSPLARRVPWMGAAQAQVTLGYGNPINSTASRSRVGFQGARSTRKFEVSGLNAEPIDGSLVYDETTVWRIHDPSNPMALSVLSLDPLVEFQQKTTRRDNVLVQRVEGLSATVSGPLATTLPADPRDWVRPQETALPAPLLSVFADTGGP